MKVKIEHEISEETIADLMTAAIEGGSAYWCDEITQQSGAKSEEGVAWYSDPEIYRAKEGTFLTLQVVESEPSSENSDGRFIINLEKMQKAFNLMGEFGTPKGFHLRNLLEENWDAETADVFLQLATFGEVVYG
jgi:hypothetical protein